MATIFNESGIAAEPAQSGASRQLLLTQERVSGTRVLLHRLTMAPGGDYACVEDCVHGTPPWSLTLVRSSFSRYRA